MGNSIIFVVKDIPGHCQYLELDLWFGPNTVE